MSGVWCSNSSAAAVDEGVAGDGGESGVRLSEGLGGGRPRWRRGQVVGAMDRVLSRANSEALSVALSLS